MKIVAPDPQLAALARRAMVTMARAAKGGVGPSHLAILHAAQQMLLHTHGDPRALASVAPQALQKNPAPPEQRRQLVRGLVVMSLAAGPTTEAQADLLKAYAGALEVDEPAVDVMTHLGHKELLRFRLDFYRRSHLRDYMGNQYRNQGGILGVAKALLGARGLMSDPALAARFDALGKQPTDTLGYAFFKMYADRGFAFPGRANGFPVGALFHDFTHVLSGYDTTPEGELCAAAFQTGYRQNEDAYFTLLFAVLTHTAGQNMTPLPQPVMLGRLGEEGVVAAMFDALKRGGAMTVDLGQDWDFWAWTDLPLDEVRDRMGIVPPSVVVPDAARFDVPPHLILP